MKTRLIPITAVALALLTGNVYAHDHPRTHHHDRDYRGHRHFEGFDRDELRFRVFHFGWPGFHVDRPHHRRGHHDRGHHNRGYRERDHHHRGRDGHHGRGHDRDHRRH